MPEIAVMAKLFNRALSILGLIREGKREKTARIERALFALYAALNVTKAYLARLESGKRRNRKQEFQLAMLWHNASVYVRLLDRDLANRCFIKGSFWLEPKTRLKDRVKNNRNRNDA